MDEQLSRQFIDIKMRPGTMFYNVPRTTILRAVREAITSFRGVVLDVGCGFMPYRGIVESNTNVEKYIGMDLAGSDIYGQAEPDIIWEGVIIPLEDASVDRIMATEFLEHHSDPNAVLSEFYRVLKPGGVLFATVPFIWNLHEIPHDEFRYTPYSLERIIGNAGFDDIVIRPLGGWNLSFAQMIGLWVTFAPMRRPIRAAMRYLLFPLFYWLTRTDRLPTSFDGGENSMFNGLSVTARRC